MKFKKKTIYGCEADDTSDSPYLTRTTLLETRFGNVYLHYFHRSDRDDLHDHPWHFVSIILWRGYIEVTEGGKRSRKWPGMILFRRAAHRHRVELVGGRPAVTLIIRSPYVREWGFLCPNWKSWREYFREKGC